MLIFHFIKRGKVVKMVFVNLYNNVDNYSSQENFIFCRLYNKLDNFLLYAMVDCYPFHPAKNDFSYIEN